jgi:hypothetical protein
VKKRKPKAKQKDIFETVIENMRRQRAELLASAKPHDGDKLQEEYQKRLDERMK